MKKIILPVLMCYAILAGCGSNNDQKVESSEKKISSTDPDSTAQRGTDTSGTDPDATDNEPVTDYRENTYGEQTEKKIRGALQKIYRQDLDKKLIPEDSRKFTFFEYDLNNDSTKEIFVGLSGPYFCGTGGCTITLLDSGANVITNFTVTNFPVIISNTATRGWNDLILESKGKTHIVKFNGKRYPSNPSIQPAFTLPTAHTFTKALNIFNDPYPKFEF